MPRSHRIARASVMAAPLLVLLALALAGYDYWQRGNGLDGCWSVGPVSACAWTINPHRAPTAGYGYGTTSP